MKITSDVTSILSGRGIRRERPAVGGRNLSPKGGPGIGRNSSILSQFRSEKTLSEALSIAQMSYSVIQKAINVSSRLRQIASQAINSGKVDSGGLQQVVSEIDSVIRDYGEKIISPAGTGGGEANRSFTDTLRQLSEVKKLAEAAGKGNVPRLEDIDEKIKSFTNLNSVVSRSVENLKKRIRAFIPQSGVGGRGEAERITGAVTGQIAGTPAAALKAQANIPQESGGINYYR